MLASFASTSARACTIVVLADEARVLFCNNEDWSNPRTRIWFVPGQGGNGCAYVGFDDGATQGGVNTDGLAFDWVAGFKETWQRDPQRKDLGPAQSPSRMLETCATVDDAIAFYEAHNEPAFAGAKIFVADRTGASAIIGIKNGRLHVDKANECRAFGVRREVATKMLNNDPKPTLANAADILKGAIQRGLYGTKYSNVFDLRSGDIFLFQFSLGSDPVKLNLAEELKKGQHVIENPTVKAPYVWLTMLTLVPSVTLMLLATLAGRRKNITITLALVAIVWGLGAGGAFFLLGKSMGRNELINLPVGVGVVSVVVCAIWFAALRKRTAVT
jgi:hypothetical protein